MTSVAYFLLLSFIFPGVKSWICTEEGNTINCRDDSTGDVPVSSSTPKSGGGSGSNSGSVGGSPQISGRIESTGGGGGGGPGGGCGGSQHGGGSKPRFDPTKGEERKLPKEASYIPTHTPYIPTREDSYKSKVTDIAVIRSNVHRMDNVPLRLKYVDLAERTARIGYNLGRKSNESSYQEMLDVLDSFTSVALSMATSTLPGVSFARDIYEAIMGTDLHTGELLSDFERGIAVLGAVTFGYGSKPLKAFEAFKVGMVKSAEGVKIAESIFNGKPRREIAQTIRFLHRHNVKLKDKLSKIEWINSFMTGSKVKVLTEDTKAYRYYTEGKNPAKGSWLTSKKTDNPQADLALKYEPKDVKEFTIPKGTEVLHSDVAPKYGQPGGADQYFVPNPEVLQ